MRFFAAVEPFLSPAVNVLQQFRCEVDEFAATLLLQPDGEQGTQMMHAVALFE